MKIVDSETRSVIDSDVRLRCERTVARTRDSELGR
jgi:hypothetical protein